MSQVVTEGSRTGTLPSSWCWLPGSSQKEQFQGSMKDFFAKHRHLIVISLILAVILAALVMLN